MVDSAIGHRYPHVDVPHDGAARVGAATIYWHGWKAAFDDVETVIKRTALRSTPTFRRTIVVTNGPAIVVVEHKIQFEFSTTLRI